MSWQNPYPASSSTIPAGDYITPSAYVPTPTAPTGYGYQDGYPMSTTTSAGTSETVGACAWHKHHIARNQEAIIALGAVCGLLIISLAVLLLLMFSSRHRSKGKLEGELVISSGGQRKSRYRRDRSEHSRGTGDDMTEYLCPPHKDRSQRRSQPVTNDEYARAAMDPGQWAAAGVRVPPAAYARYPGGPVIYQGQGNEQAVPVIPVPMPPQRPQPQTGSDGIGSGRETGESELGGSSSSSQTETQSRRQSSGRRRRSRTSGSGRRSGGR